jgi:DNA polymerase kappa
MNNDECEYRAVPNPHHRDGEDDDRSSSSSVANDDDEHRRRSGRKTAASEATGGRSGMRHPSSSSSSSSAISSTSTRSASALLASASDKAGMEDVDRDAINAILLRESGDTSYMQRQRRVDEYVNVRIRDMKRRLEEKDDEDFDGGDWRERLNRDAIDPLLLRYKQRRERLSTCVVIDMDGFYISCHALENPTLANVPSCVGNSSMISTSNYVARKYGVRAAMPGYLGTKLVHELSGGTEKLTFVEHDFVLYGRKSNEVRSILVEYDPHLAMHSLDEAYMDIGPYLMAKLSPPRGGADVGASGGGGMSHDDIRGRMASSSSGCDGAATPEDDDDATTTMRRMARTIEDIPIGIVHAAAVSLLHDIRDRIRTSTGLTCSAGLCSNFLLAKIAR